MRSANGANGRKELIDKLETIRALAGDCLALLTQHRRLVSSTPHRTGRSSVSVSATPLHFESNARAYVKRHTKGLSGPAKFVLLLAYLTKGNTSNEVPLGDIKKLWNTMKSKSLLGKFNLAFANRAKDGGWVDSKKRGFYNLHRSWKDVLSNG
jgi:hypothetical protein